MLSVLVLFGALYAKCPHHAVLYMNSVLIIQCFICKVSLLYTALYAKLKFSGDEQEALDVNLALNYWSQGVNAQQAR